ncbi:MAG: hypothetical protein JSV49_04295 [Thermoplasmata archaeon]|nr:MAG: hypothetical protein JSV49_04295 [Thermoplasmata archaeon]
MMDKIYEMYTQLLDNGEKPDTAVMNYRTYQKLISDLGGSTTFISPPAIFLQSGKKLAVEINDTLEDEEIIICEGAKPDLNIPWGK